MRQETFAKNLRPELFTLRLTTEERQEIDRLAELFQTDRAKLVRWLLQRGMQTLAVQKDAGR